MLHFMTAIIIVLAIFGAFCELAAAAIAARELIDASQARRTVLDHQPDWMEVLATDHQSGLNMLEVGRLRDAVLEIWTLRRSSVIVLAVVVPSGILAEMTATIIAALG